MRVSRAVAYIRVSDEGGRGADLMSPAIQHAAITAHCRARGHALIATLEDIDETGRLWRRRKIEAAVKMIEAGTADVIVVWKISRVARDRLDWAIAVDRVESAGGQMESATEPLDTSTSTGRFTRGMLAELAAFESDRIGEGWKETHRQRFDAGLPSNGRVPWGWINGHRQVTPDPGRAPVVAELYRRYLAGAGFHTLARWLDENGHETARGARWHANTVRAMLDSPVHAGLVLLNGETKPGQHTGIVTAELFERYQAMRRDKRRQGRVGTSPYLLSGLLHCVCGSPMHGGRPAAPRYLCRAAIEERAHPRGIVAARPVDAAVFTWLTGLAGQLNEAIDQRPDPPGPGAVADLGERVAELDRRLATLTVHLASGLVPEPAYRAARDEITAQRTAIVGAMRRARDREVLTPAAPRRAAFDLVAEWPTLPVDTRRAALRELISHVTVTIVPLTVQVTTP